VDQGGGDIPFRIIKRTNDADSTAVTIKNQNGYVGIGTASPGQKLSIYTGSTATSALSFDRFSSGNYRTDIYQNVYGPDFRVGYDGYTPESILYLKRFSDGRKEVEINGNVGIGTASPGTKLHVNGSASTGTTILIDGPTQGNSGGPNNDPWTALELRRLGTSGETYNGSVNLRAYRWATSGADPAMALTFNLSSTQPYNTADIMTLRSNGNVGIGLTSPASKLHLFGTNAASLISRSESNASGYAVYDQYYNSGSSKTGYCGIDGTGLFGQSTGALALGTNDTPIIFSPYYSTGEKMRINTNGNVGIGTPTPHAKLHINGAGSGVLSSSSRAYYRFNDYNGTYNSLVINTGNWSSMSIYATDSIVTYTYLTSHAGTISASDTRIKKNIVDADDAECLETLRLLKPKKYQYKDEINRGQEPVWGFIAQEVRDTLPYATELRRDVLPNIYELANVSSSNVITFVNFNTSNLESNATTLIRTKGIDGGDHDIHLVEVIDEHAIRVEEDLSEWIGSVDETGNVVAGNQLFIYGQEVDDFVFLKKEAIWTVATAALQEVDRQLQAEKAKTATLETQLADLLARVQALETV
jgi:hypothetical protein